MKKYVQKSSEITKNNYDTLLISHYSENFLHLKITILLADTRFIFNCILIYFVVCAYILQTGRQIA